MTSRAVISAVGFVLYTGAVVIGSQQVQRDTTTGRRPNERTDGSAIRGQVLAAETGAPLRRAQVTLLGGGPEPPVIATDDQGRFVFNNIAAGRYTITAAKAGYATLAYGQRRPGEAGKDVNVARGASFDNAVISLPEAGVIIARVTDDLGEPMVDVTVRALQQRFVNGERQLVAVSQGDTDVHGERRLSGLLPGGYYVMADPSRLPVGDRRVLGPTYYPGTHSRSDARPITVAISEETRASFALSAVRLAQVSGILRASDGSPGVGLAMRLVNLADGAAPAPAVSRRADGTFSIANVLPGDYVLYVEPSSSGVPNPTREYASVPVKVSGEDVSIEIRTSSGGSARGRFQFESGQLPGLRLGALVVAAMPVQRLGGRGPQSRSSATDWTFEVEGLTGPALFRLGPAPGATEWYLKAVMFEGADVTDTPLDFSGDRKIENLAVTVTREKTTVSGTAVDAAGEPATEYVAVFFPEDPRLRNGWSRHIAAARPDQRGNFTIPGLPPGRYMASAIDYLPPGEERDPDLLNRLETGAARMTLSDGQAATVTLKVNSY